MLLELIQIGNMHAKHMNMYSTHIICTPEVPTELLSYSVEIGGASHVRVYDPFFLLTHECDI